MEWVQFHLLNYSIQTTANVVFATGKLPFKLEISRSLHNRVELFGYFKVHTGKGKD